MATHYARNLGGDVFECGEDDDSEFVDSEDYAELQAQTEALRTQLTHLAEWIQTLSIPTRGACTQLKAIDQVLAATPQQCLSNVQKRAVEAAEYGRLKDERLLRATAGREGFIACAVYFHEFLKLPENVNVEDCANNYFKFIEAGEL